MKNMSTFARNKCNIMALNQTNSLFWLIGVISKAGRITFDEINRRWVAEERLSGGKELSKRTFHKWIDAVQDRFDLLIENEGRGDYNYFIPNWEELKEGSVERWLFNQHAISNSLQDCKSIKDRILLEDVPSGQEYLDSIIDAMKQNRLIHITHQSYWREEERTYYIMPLCVKLFRQRWYVVGKSWSSGHIRVYALDRIHDFRLSSHTFEYPKDFSPEEFFYGCIGVITGDDNKIERVRLKVSAQQSKFLRSLPICASQREVETHDDFCIFEMEVRPTFDFQQEILWNGPDVEVLAPEWLRKQIAGKIEKMNEMYKQ